MMNIKTYKENVSLMLYGICSINKFFSKNEEPSVTIVSVMTHTESSLEYQIVKKNVPPGCLLYSQNSVSLLSLLISKCGIVFQISSNPGTQLDILQFNSILTLATWSWESEPTI